MEAAISLALFQVSQLLSSENMNPFGKPRDQRMVEYQMKT